MTTSPAQIGPAGARRVRRSGRRSRRLASMFEAVLVLSRDSSSIARPIMSRAGIRAEARRVRSIMRARMRDNQPIGGK
jgi:hypothetical protein